MHATTRNNYKAPAIGVVAAIGMILSCSAESTAIVEDATSGSTDSQVQLCTNVDAFVDGIAKESDNGWTFQLVASMLVPPDKGVNEFTVAVQDMESQRSDLRVVITPTMPNHNHGTFPPTFEAISNDDGHYVIGPMDLFMSGRWEFLVQAFKTDEVVDGPLGEVTFAFCLQG